jgi:hypothetical protein
MAREGKEERAARRGLSSVYSLLVKSLLLRITLQTHSRATLIGTSPPTLLQLLFSLLELVRQLFPSTLAHTVSHSSPPPCAQLVCRALFLALLLSCAPCTSSRPLRADLLPHLPQLSPSHPGWLVAAVEEVEVEVEVAMHSPSSKRLDLTPLSCTLPPSLALFAELTSPSCRT